MITVNHYGLHWIEGDIALLVQDKRVDHALDLPITYEVTTTIPRRGLTCPHRIDLSQAVDQDIPDRVFDRLGQFFLPIPKEFGDKALFLEDRVDNKQLIQQLLRLSGGGTMFPLWQMRPELATAHLHLTNLQPLVIFGCRPEYAQALSKIIEASYTAPRRLVVMGPRHTILRTEIERWAPGHDPEDYQHRPLEQIGAGILKRHMLRRD